MPFVALKQSTGARIDITSFKRPKAEIDPNDIVCQMPDCGQHMHVRAPWFARAHFVHTSKCTTEFASHEESFEHSSGKLAIASALRETLKRESISGVSIEYEVPIPEAGRVVDVLARYPNGRREAHECQFAAITPQELDERTASLEQLGVDVYWWIGEGRAADSRSVREWCADRRGECYWLIVRSGDAYESLDNTGRVAEAATTDLSRTEPWDRSSGR
jgi:competence CoiA-like predicted nuclease